MEGSIDGKEILESLSLVEGSTLAAKTEESTGGKKVRVCICEVGLQEVYMTLPLLAWVYVHICM